jgi:hypothetical protein
MGELKNIIVRVVNGVEIVEFTEETITTNKVVMSKNEIKAKIVLLQAQIDMYQSWLAIEPTE